MVRIGLIGCGEHSEVGHAIPLARYKAEYPGDLELSAVCDLRPERADYFRLKYGFLNSYPTMDSMLAAQPLDLCIAVVPVEKISAVGIELLQRGIPCVVEKPLGATLSEVTSLRDAARATGTANMVSVNRRFMPLLNRALEWTTMTRHARTEPAFLSETAVHSVDALRYIAGPIRSASICQMKRDHALPKWYGIDIEFADGTLGRVDVLPTAGMIEETYELSGEGFRAMVTCPFGPERGMRCYRENRLVLRASDQDMPEDVVFGFYDEAVSTIGNLSRGAPLNPAIAEVYPSVELCFNLVNG
jgi:predicted dehydrogenase